MIVVDASAVVDLLLQRNAEPLMTRLLDDGEPLHAPHLLDVEVAQVIRRYWRAGELPSARSSQALSDLLDLPVTRHGHEPLLERVWQLRHNVTAYDAVYLALAEALAAPLVTRDRALMKVPGVTAHVEII